MIPLAELKPQCLLWCLVANMRCDFNSDKYEVCFWISGHITLVGSSEHINRDAGTRGKNCNLQINFGRKNGTKDTENWNGTLIIDQLRSTWKQCQTLSNICTIASEKTLQQIKQNTPYLLEFFSLGIWRGKFFLNVPYVFWILVEPCEKLS